MKIATHLGSRIVASVQPSAARPAMVRDTTSVVILTYNSMKSIGDCIKSVIRNVGASDEILLVDNGSTDGTQDFLRKILDLSPQVKVLLNRENLGFAAGANVGLRAAHGEYIVLLDPDTIVTPGWQTRMARQFGHGRVGAVGPVIDTAEGPQKVNNHVPADLAGFHTYDGISQVLAETNPSGGMITKHLSGACLMLSRVVLDEVGLLDETLFLGCEDLDIAWRLGLAGYKMIIARDAFVHHKSHVSFDSMPRMKTDRLVRESWNKLATKLIGHYGYGCVPAPEDLFGIEEFQASDEIWKGACRPLEGASTILSSQRLERRTSGTLAAKIARDCGAASVIEIGQTKRQLLPGIDANHLSISAELLPLSPQALANAVVICDGVHLTYEQLSGLVEHALAVVVGLPTSGPGLPDGLPVLFEGTTPTIRDQQGERSRIWVLDRTARNLQQQVPDSFRPVALMTTFNDIDVIDSVLNHTVAQGMRIVVMDNWSTDGTYERLMERAGELELLEQFPPEGPSETFDQIRILQRQEEIAQRFEGQWITIQASDELRVSPWAGVTFREGLYMAESRGFTCVDFTILEFNPVDNSYESGCDLEKTLRFFEFGQQDSSLIQQKTWKQPAARVNASKTGGHVVFFDGKSVYPYKFVLKHYSIRSQAQGEMKVFGMRQTRWNEEERTKLGWHTHYDSMTSGHNFLRRKEELTEFDSDRFAQDLVVERISGIGSIPGIDWRVVME